MTGPDGAPLRAAFVQARHGKLKMTVSVLTDNAGRYAVENLPAGEYRLSVRALGAKAEPRSGIALAADGTAAHDFALQSAPVRWSDLTILQGLQLLPEARGKQTLFDNCLSCHGFQSKMAAVTTDEDGWRTRVEFMREAMRSSLADRAGFSDAQADEVVSYLTHVFGEASVLPKSPTELAAYRGHHGEGRRRGAQHRLCRFRNARAQSFPLDRASRRRRQFLDPAIRGVEPDRALQSCKRRDQGVSRPASRPGADPFRGAGA